MSSMAEGGGSVDSQPEETSNTQQAADTPQDTTVNLPDIPAAMNLRPTTDRLQEPLRGMISGLLPRLNNEYIIPGPNGEMINISIGNGQRHGHSHNHNHGHSHGPAEGMPHAGGHAFASGHPHGAVGHSHGPQAQAHAHSHAHSHNSGPSHDMFFAGDRQYDAVPVTRASPASPLYMNSPSPASTSSSSAFVVTVGNPNDDDNNAANIPDENQNVGPHGHTHGAQPQGQQAPQATTGINLRSIVKWLEGSAPFLLLMFIKVMYDHRLGV